MVEFGKSAADFWRLGRSFKSTDVIVQSPPEGQAERSFELARALALNKDLVGPTATLFLNSAPSDLSRSERIATLLFSGLVYTVDDILDESHEYTFETEAELGDFLYSSKAIVGENEIDVGEIIQETLALLPGNKQQILTEFLREMIEFQVRVGNKGFPGEYGFDDALGYKKTTDMAFINAGFEIAGATNGPNQATNVSRSVLAFQMCDDAFDVFEDAKAGTQNLLVGAANDVWLANGKQRGRDLDFLVATLADEQTSNPTQFLRGQEMRETRRYYRQIYDDLLSTEGGVPFRRGLQLMKFRVM